MLALLNACFLSCKGTLLRTTNYKLETTAEFVKLKMHNPGLRAKPSIRQSEPLVLGLMTCAITNDVCLLLIDKAQCRPIIMAWI